MARMTKDLSPAEKLSQWYYKLDYDQLTEDRKNHINYIIADLFESTKRGAHWIYYVLIAAGIFVLGACVGFWLAGI